MKLEHLAKLCADKKVEYIDKGNGHIQLQGPLLVNYYPSSKNRSAYVAGTTKGINHVTPEAAVALCFSAPTSQGSIDKRSGNSRRKRAVILRTLSTCYWCDKPLTLDTSTLEHIIPLSRGGLDNANNRTVACVSCNGERGSEMPELEDLE